MNRKRISGTISIIAILVFCIILIIMNIEKPLERDKDKEFASGSNISIEQISDVQAESLYKLCKVWGFAKYHHPSVVDGTLNWDAELFRIIPKVLESQNQTETNNILYNWLAQFPFEVTESTEIAQEWSQIREEMGGFQVDTTWIMDSENLGIELSTYLEALSRTYILDRENAYASFSDDSPTVSFENESMMNFTPEDDGVKLLSLFRFWNIYEYYSPNVEITKTDWNQVLQNSISKVLSTENYRDYVLIMASVIAETADAHIMVSDKYNTILNYYGKYYLPCSFKTVDGKVIVSSVSQSQDEQSLKSGDILLEIDGITITKRIQELSKYTALPEEDKYDLQLYFSLLKSVEKQASVKLIRDNKELDLQVECLTTPYMIQNPFKNGLIEGNQIGYIDPSALKEGDLETLMEEFSDTKGIIVDLRYYPSVFLPYLLGEYITPEPKQFAKLGMNVRAIPGAFVYDDNFYTGAGVLQKDNPDKDYPLYEGKVVLLIDETTKSQPEFTAMALRQSPNAVVIGNPSIGADGNVVRVSLPGNISFSFSGLGVYTPEGGQTQRVGIQPDIECYPTIQGLKENRDELIEKAIETILSE